MNTLNNIQLVNKNNYPSNIDFDLLKKNGIFYLQENKFSLPILKNKIVLDSHKDILFLIDEYPKVIGSHGSDYNLIINYNNQIVSVVIDYRLNSTINGIGKEDYGVYDDYYFDYFPGETYISIRDFLHRKIKQNKELDKPFISNKKLTMLRNINGLLFEYVAYLSGNVSDTFIDEKINVTLNDKQITININTEINKVYDLIFRGVNTGLDKLHSINNNYDVEKLNGFDSEATRMLFSIIPEKSIFNIVFENDEITIFRKFNSEKNYILKKDLTEEEINKYLKLYRYICLKRDDVIDYINGTIDPSCEILYDDNKYIKLTYSDTFRTTRTRYYERFNGYIIELNDYDIMNQINDNLNILNKLEGDIENE